MARARWTGAERAKLATKFEAEYRAGATMRQIAAAHGVAYGTVHKLLRLRRVPMRARGGRMAKRDGSVSAEELWARLPLGGGALPPGGERAGNSGAVGDGGGDGA